MCFLEMCPRVDGALKQFHHVLTPEAFSFRAQMGCRYPHQGLGAARSQGFLMVVLGTKKSLLSESQASNLPINF